LDKARRGKDPFPPDIRPSREGTSFTELAERYINRECPELVRGSEVESLIRRRLIPAWRRLTVDEISKRDLVRLTDQLILDEGKPAAANRLHEVCVRIFNWADRRGELERPPPFHNMDRPGAKVVRDRVLSTDEIRRLWTAWDELSMPFGLYFKMLLITGQRRSEVSHMEWDHLDTERRLWTIPREMTKSRRSHVVPLSDMACQILEEVPRIAASPFVFTGASGRTPISGFSKLKNRSAALAGVTGWRLHDLRRSAATGMAKHCGISEFVIGKVLNHSPRGVTAVHYNQYEYEEETRRALDAWGSYLQSILGDPDDTNIVPLRA
jgi:integrase